MNTLSVTLPNSELILVPKIHSSRSQSFTNSQVDNRPVKGRSSCKANVQHAYLYTRCGNEDVSMMKYVQTETWLVQRR